MSVLSFNFFSTGQRFEDETLFGYQNHSFSINFLWFLFLILFGTLGFNFSNISFFRKSKPFFRLFQFLFIVRTGFLFFYNMATILKRNCFLFPESIFSRWYFVLKQDHSFFIIFSWFNFWFLFNTTCFNFSIIYLFQKTEIILFQRIFIFCTQFLYP